MLGASAPAWQKLGNGISPRSDSANCSGLKAATAHRAARNADGVSR